MRKISRDSLRAGRMHLATLALAAALLGAAAPPGYSAAPPSYPAAPMPSPGTGMGTGTGTGAPPVMPSMQVQYQELLATAKAHPEGANYTALRMAYVASSAYDPMGSLNERIALSAAAKSQDWDGVAQKTEQMLAHDWTDILAHIDASAAYDKLGNPEAAALHRIAATGLLRSIASSGDGKSEATAYVLIGASEMPPFLAILKLHEIGSSMVRDSYHVFNRVDAADAQGNPRQVFFNLDLSVAAVARMINTRQKSL